MRMNDTLVSAEVQPIPLSVMKWNAKTVKNEFGGLLFY